jgi:hypothetical protein
VLFVQGVHHEAKPIFPKRAVLNPIRKTLPHPAADSARLIFPEPDLSQRFIRWIGQCLGDWRRITASRRPIVSGSPLDWLPSSQFCHVLFWLYTSGLPIV